MMCHLMYDPEIVCTKELKLIMVFAKVCASKIEQVKLSEQKLSIKENE